MNDYDGIYGVFDYPRVYPTVRDFTEVYVYNYD
jgi:hypothetical protein